MSRVLSPSFVLLLVALGCNRKAEPTWEIVGPPSVNPPVVVRPEPLAPAPDDGSIPPPREVKVRSRAESLALGVDYLLARHYDGWWRSDVYATFKDGTALTPLVVVALQEAHDAGVRNPALGTTLKSGCNTLARFVGAEGTIVPPEGGFDYPVYTAALALKALSHPTAKDFAHARGAWVKYLKERQLTEKLGWKPEEKQYGGWGYCRVIPKKPEPNTFAPPLIESNLSATLFALHALKAADALDAETAKAAAVFVRRCQNVDSRPPGAAPVSLPAEFTDGGFHFIYDDPTRNKAGRTVVPVEIDGPPHLVPVFHSYGSTTADGLQALALCNDTADKHRRAAARDWLVKNFRADSHPGTYVKAHEPNRDAVYFYYAASAARAFRDHKLDLPAGRDWREELSHELAKRQAKDGSWTNPVELVRENDPLVATSSAVLALARCRKP